MQSLLLLLTSLLLVEALGGRKGGLGRRKESEGEFVLVGGREGADYIDWMEECSRKKGKRKHKISHFVIKVQ